jgi:hypothetical protein
MVAAGKIKRRTKMFRKLIMLISLISFFPAAAGARDVALLTNPVNISPHLEKQMTVVAANDVQGDLVMEARPHRSHEGLTFKEFAEVHWGGYRWVYWAGAVTGLVLLHIPASSHH